MVHLHTPTNDLPAEKRSVGPVEEVEEAVNANFHFLDVAYCAHFGTRTEIVLSRVNSICVAI